MTPHHIINEIDQIQMCPYCKNNLSEHKWDSMFEINHHYKETLCSKCNKSITIKVNFHGSGHDCWDSKSCFCKSIGRAPVDTLEERLEEKLKKATFFS